ncbi:MAG: hypothetical protein LBC35_07710 [Coriobacteriales bacterium]|jgi:hypothetical protein|nr:hypothetical protein [Coriobacteriales bacterium]
MKECRTDRGIGNTIDNTVSSGQTRGATIKKYALMVQRKRSQYKLHPVTGPIRATAGLTLVEAVVSAAILASAAALIIGMIISGLQMANDSVDKAADNSSVTEQIAYDGTPAVIQSETYGFNGVTIDVVRKTYIENGYVINIFEPSETLSN